MRQLLFLPVLASALGFASILAGCPQGVGGEMFRQDDTDDGGDTDGGDADALLDGATPDGEPPASSGALCGVNGLDQCGPYMICNAALGCVECSSDADCPASASACLQGRCVGCRPGIAPADAGAPSDCSSATACWVSDYECHARCTGEGSCQDGLRCVEATGECVGCTNDTDCASGVCSQATRRCVECTANGSCPGSRPLCRIAEGTCVACLSNDDCGISAPICDPTIFTCRVGCSSDAQCPGQRCDVAVARCVDLPVPTADASSDGG